MIKKRLSCLLFVFFVIACFCGCNNSAEFRYTSEDVSAQCVSYSSNTDDVYLGGFPAGFTLGVGGLQVVGICDVLTKNGNFSPAKNGNINVGDIIVSINGRTIDSIESLDKTLLDVPNESVEVVLNRNGDNIKTTLTPVKDAFSGRLKLGVLVRDSVAGIGTVTYIRKSDLRFGSLGHGVLTDKNVLMSLGSKSVYRCSIIGVTRGVRGKAGELKGLFLNSQEIAKAEKNIDSGIYGNFNSDYDLSFLPTAKVAEKGFAKVGSAKIYATTSGVSIQEYDIQIVKVDTNQPQNKNFIIKINDNDLIEKTGGIVQGMSGSPIVQDGQLIGAITHVFLNDSTRGFGIGIENMINN